MKLLSVLKIVVSQNAKGAKKLATALIDLGFRYTTYGDYIFEIIFSEEMFAVEAERQIKRKVDIKAEYLIIDRSEI